MIGERLFGRESRRAGPVQRRGSLPRTLYLMCSGLSTWAQSGRLSGQEDPPLSHLGQAQAQRLEAVMRERPLHAVYCSDLRRARDTAAAVAHSHDVSLHMVPALRAQHLGILQGTSSQLFDDHCAQLGASDRLSFRPPGGGESFADLAASVGAWLHAMLDDHNQEDILVLAHRNTARALLSELLGWPRDKSLDLPVSPRWLYRITPNDRTPLTSVSLRRSDLGVGHEGIQF